MGDRAKRGLRRQVIYTVQNSLVKAIQLPRKLTHSKRQYVADVDEAPRPGEPMTQLQTLAACQLEVMSTSGSSAGGGPDRRTCSGATDGQEHTRASDSNGRTGTTTGSPPPPLPPFWSIRLEAAREAERFDEEELFDSRNVVLERHASTMGYPPNYEQANEVPISMDNLALGGYHQHKMRNRLKRLKKSLKHQLIKHLPRFLINWIEHLQRRRNQLRRQRKTGDVLNDSSPSPHLNGGGGGGGAQLPVRPASQGPAGRGSDGQHRQGGRDTTAGGQDDETNESHRMPSNAHSNASTSNDQIHRHPQSPEENPLELSATSTASLHRQVPEESNKLDCKRSSCASRAAASLTSGASTRAASPRASFEAVLSTTASGRIRPSKHQLRQKLHLSFSSSSSDSSSAASASSASSASSSLMADLNLQPSSMGADGALPGSRDTTPSVHGDQRGSDLENGGSVGQFRRGKLPRSNVINFAQLVQEDLENGEQVDGRNQPIKQRAGDQENDDDHEEELGEDDISVSSASVSSSSSSQSFGAAPNADSLVVTPISSITQCDESEPLNWQLSHRDMLNQHYRNQHQQMHNQQYRHSTHAAMVPRSTTYNGGFTTTNNCVNTDDAHYLRRDSRHEEPVGAPPLTYNEAYAWQARSLAHLQQIQFQQAAEEANAAAQLWHLHLQQQQHVASNGVASAAPAAASTAPPSHHHAHHQRHEGQQQFVGSHRLDEFSLRSEHSAARSQQNHQDDYKQHANFHAPPPPPPPADYFASQSTNNLGFNSSNTNNDNNNYHRDEYFQSQAQDHEAALVNELHQQQQFNNQQSRENSFFVNSEGYDARRTFRAIDQNIDTNSWAASSQGAASRVVSANNFDENVQQLPRNYQNQENNFNDNLRHHPFGRHQLPRSVSSYAASQDHYHHNQSRQRYLQDMARQDRRSKDSAANQQEKIHELARDILGHDLKRRTGDTPREMPLPKRRLRSSSSAATNSERAFRARSSLIVAEPPRPLANHNKRRNSSDLLGGCAVDRSRRFIEDDNEDGALENSLALLQQHQQQQQPPVLLINSHEIRSPTAAKSSVFDQQLIMPTTREVSKEFQTHLLEQQQQQHQQQQQQHQQQPQRQRIVLQASTSELMKCLSDFLHSRCPKLAHFPSSQVISWLHNVDRSLLVQGWQEIAFINPANVVFLYMLLRDLIHEQIEDEHELQCIVMTSLYLSYAYMGNEISYPLQPFLCEQDSHERFWNRTLNIINLLSSKMLRLNADKSFFAEVFSELKYFSPSANNPPASMVAITSTDKIQ